MWQQECVMHDTSVPWFLTQGNSTLSRKCVLSSRFFTDMQTSTMATSDYTHKPEGANGHQNPQMLWGHSFWRPCRHLVIGFDIIKKHYKGSPQFFNKNWTLKTSIKKTNNGYFKISSSNLNISGSLNFQKYACLIHIWIFWQEGKGVSFEDDHFNAN